MRLRVFVPAKEFLAAGIAGATIVHKYESFVVVQVPPERFEEIRQRWIFEELEEDREAREAPAANRTSKSHWRLTLGGPLRDEWRRRLQKAGLQIVEARGRRALVVHGDPASFERAKGLNFVQRIEAAGMRFVESPARTASAQTAPTPRSTKGKKPPARPHAAPALASRAAGGIVPVFPNLMRITFFSPAALHEALPRICRVARLLEKPAARDASAAIELPSGDPRKALGILEKMEGVKRMSEIVVPRTRNDVAIRLMNAAHLGSKPPEGLELDGAGEIIAVVDSGLDSGVPALVHPDLAGRVKRMKSYPIHPSFARDVRNRGRNDGPIDKNSGHGTHVAGSIAGDGSIARKQGIPDPARGLATRAELFIQGIEREMDWKPAYLREYENRNGQFPDRFILGGMSVHSIRPLLADAYQAGARIQNNSWTSGVLGDYNELAADVDRFVWDHKDFCVLFAAGNSGVPDGNGNIVRGSIEPPGTAKNCITVGACESERPQIRDTYGDFWPSDFSGPPHFNDAMANDHRHVAAFSSRGPTQDGRFKPDLIAPGTFILSLRSRFLARNQWAWAKYAECRDYFYMGGTSMATPLVTGAAALVRQHLRRTLKTIPSAALIKATLIHGARRYPAADEALADHDQGWGLVDLTSSLCKTSSRRVCYVDMERGLRTGQHEAFEIRIRAGQEPLKLTLAWTDFPGERVVNNLNLIVRTPHGRHLAGNDFSGQGSVDRVNNVEGLLIRDPEPGTYLVQVVASEVQEAEQDFALVFSGDIDGESRGRGWGSRNGSSSASPLVRMARGSRPAPRASRSPRRESGGGRTLK